MIKNFYRVKLVASLFKFPFHTTTVTRSIRRELVQTYKYVKIESLITIYSDSPSLHYRSRLTIMRIHTNANTMCQHEVGASNRQPFFLNDTASYENEKGTEHPFEDPFTSTNRSKKITTIIHCTIQGNRKGIDLSQPGR